jgi:hypothetical protein
MVTRGSLDTDEDELREASGHLADAVSERPADFLRIQALRCLRLASQVPDDSAAEILRRMASEYSQQARELGARGN